MSNLKSSALLLGCLFALLSSCSKPPTISIQGKKDIQPMDELVLSWSTTGATSVRIEGVNKKLPTKGEIKFSPNETTTYRFIVQYNNRKPVIQEYKVNVKKIPLKFEFFKISPAEATSNDLISMAWRFKGADTVVFYNVPQFKNKKNQRAGEEKFFLEDTTMIRVVASNRFGDRIDTTFKINVKKIEFFKAPATTYRNENFLLQWQINNVKHVSITGIGDSLPPKSKATFAMTEPKDFTLTATKDDGSIFTETIHVDIAPTEIVYLESKKNLENGRDVVKLRWRAGGVSQVSIPKISNNFLPAKGFVDIQVEGTEIYEMIIIDENGKRITKSIEVEGNKRLWNTAGSMQKTEDEKLPNGTIYRGETSYLYWNLPKEVVNFEVEGFGKGFKLRDSVLISPIQTTSYRIKAQMKDKNGQLISVNYDHTVQVIRKDYIKNTRSASTLLANEEIFFDIIAIDRSEYPNSLKFRVIVTDKNGNFVSDLAPPYCSEGLCRRYFLSVAEKVNNDKATTIQNFQVKGFNQLNSKPYSIALSMDYSGSMSGEVESAEAAAISMIRGKHPQDEFSLVKFDDEIGLEIEKLQQSELEILQLAGFHHQIGMPQNYGGGTALYAGADAALNTLKDSQNNKVMILLTDGQENSSFGYIGQYAVKPSELVRNARHLGIRVYTIAYGKGANNDVLNNIAQHCDGQFYRVNSQKQAKEAYNDLARIFHNYYEITFTPTNADGKRDIFLTYYDNKGNTPTTTTKAYFGENLDELDGADLPYDLRVNLNTNINTQTNKQNTTNTSQNNVATQTNNINHGGAQKSTKTQTMIKNIAPRPIAAPQAVAHFAENSDVIEAQYFKRIDNIANYLKQNKTVIIEIWGHSDLRGNDEETYQISLRRAEAIKKYLIKAGVPEKRMTIKAWGKTRPVWQIEEHEWQRHENRRIEIVLFQ